MVLTIGSWFSEPGVEFKVSHKVHKFIRESLIEDVMKPFGLETKDPDIFIGLVITTRKNIEELEVRGPEYDRRNKFINYGLWLPYKKIDEAENYLKEYLKYFFDALVILFKKYDVPEENIRKVQHNVEAEVLNNINYRYVE